MLKPSLRTSFLVVPCLSLLVPACGGATSALQHDDDTTQSLSSPSSFPLGVEASCSASVLQLTPGLQGAIGVTSPVDPLPTVTLTSSGNAITATIAGTTSPFAPVQFTPLSGTTATIVPGQSLSVPTFQAASAASTNGTTLPIDGGSLTFTGDSFFLALEMAFPNNGGTISAVFDCAAAAKAPTDCACSTGEVRVSRDRERADRRIVNAKIGAW